MRVVIIIFSILNVLLNGCETILKSGDDGDAECCESCGRWVCKEHIKECECKRQSCIICTPELWETNN
jgi:uncharacterized protein YceK